LNFDDRFPAACSPENYPGIRSTTAIGGRLIIVSCVGGKFLYENKHVNFLVSEAVGIFGGVLLMLMAAGIAMKNKPSRRE
jgi:hypothetical protein